MKSIKLNLILLGTIIIGIGYYILMVQYKLIELSGTYISILPILILIILIIKKSNLEFKGNIFEFSRPSMIFIFISFLFFGLGTLNQILQNAVGTVSKYNNILDKAYSLVFLALSAWYIGYQAMKMIGIKNNLKQLEWDKNYLIINLIVGIFGIFAFIVFFYFVIGYIPLFSGVAPNVAGELRDIVFGKGRFINVIAVNLSSIALIFLIHYLSYSSIKKNLFPILIVIILILFFFLWGARIYLFFPVAIAILLLRKRNVIRSRTIIIGFVFITFIGGIYGLIRNYKVMEVTIKGNIYNENLISFIANTHIAPEFREYLDVLDKKKLVENKFQPEIFFDGAFSTMIPEQVLSLFGINKDFFSVGAMKSSGWVLGRYLRGSVFYGIRAGILTEVYLYFGIGGILLWFFMMGAIFRFLDIKTYSLSIKDSRIIYYYFLTVLFSYSWLGTIDSLSFRFWYVSYYFIFLVLVSSRKILNIK